MSQSKFKLKHYLLGLAVLALVGGGLFYTSSPTEKKIQLITAKVIKTDMEETVLASGTLEASKLVSVGAQVSGQIKSLKVQLGDVVKKGQLIAEIDSLTQQNNLRNAMASLENIQAQKLAKAAELKQAELIFERQKNLYAHDAVSRESYQTAEANLATSQAAIAAIDAQISQAKITVDTAKVNLGYTKITAPINGTVVAIPIEEGQTVNAAQQAPTIIKLAQLENMQIKAEISEADITRVKPGQNVYFTILGEPDHRYTATLRSIEPAPESISSDSSSTSSSSSSSSNAAIYYNGLFDTPNPDGKLRISMTAEINIVLNEAKGTLAIPRTALNKPNSDGTYTVRLMKTKDHIEERIIRTGINNNVSVQVLDGLQEGNDVVVEEAATKDTPTIPRRSPMRF